MAILDIRLVVVLLGAVLGSLPSSPRSGTWMNTGLRGGISSMMLEPGKSGKAGNSTQWKKLLREPGTLCSSLKGLSQGQTKLCRLSHDHMPSVARGAKVGIRECQHQFRHRRWNCSTFDDDNGPFGPLLDIGETTRTFSRSTCA